MFQVNFNQECNVPCTSYLLQETIFTGFENGCQQDFTKQPYVAHLQWWMQQSFSYVNAKFGLDNKNVFVK